MLFDRYEKYQKYINGVPADPPEYMKGDYLGQYDFPTLEDCEAIAQYRWVETGNTICVDYSLYNEEKKQVSTDGGITWKDTDERRGGTLIEEHSVECGWRLLEEWQEVRDLCRGYNLETEYELRRSEDMGDTWEGTGIFKYIVKEFVNYDCSMQAEPLTYQIEVSEETLVRFPLMSDDYVNVAELYDKKDMAEQYKCYIDWGLGGNIREYTDEGNFTTTFPAGTYIVKFWGLFDTINSPNCKHSVISWGEANNAAPARLVQVNIFGPSDNYDYSQPYPDSPTNKTYTTDGFNTPKTDRYYVSPTRIELTNVDSIPQDPKSTLRYITDFSCSLLNADIPNGLFESCERLRRVSFDDSSITSIPLNLFHKCYLSSISFNNCKNLVTVPDIITAGRPPSKFIGGLMYKDMGEPVMKCKKCLMDDKDVTSAISACQDIYIRLRYQKDWGDVPYCWTNVPPDINTYPANGFLWFPQGWDGFGKSLTTSGYETLIKLLTANMSSGGAWMIDITLSDDWAISGQYFYDRFPMINNTRYIQIPGVYENPICYWPQTDWQDYIHIEGDYIYQHPYKLTPKYRYARIYQYAADNPFEWIYETEGKEPEITVSFANCTALTSINILSIPKFIAADFTGCSSLINIPELNTAEGAYVSFKDCTSLTDINIDVNWGTFNFQNTTFQNATIKCIKGCSMERCFVGSSIKTCNIIGTPNNTERMFYKTSVEEVNINAESPIYNGSYMFREITSDVKIGIVSFTYGTQFFSGATNLTSTGGVTLLQHASRACENCTSLVTVGANFLGGLHNCDASFCFESCTSLESVPNELIDDDFDLSQPDTSNVEYMFSNCSSLTTWIKNDQDIWDWRRFLNDEGDRITTMAYEGCSKIIPEVPIPWGGLEVDFSVCIEYTLEANTIYRISNYHAVLVDDTKWEGKDYYLTPGEHNIKVYTGYSSYNFPYKYQDVDNYYYVTSILQLGNLQEINNYSKCRYICSGDHLWETRTNLNRIFYNCDSLTDVADDIFKNCKNVNQMNSPFQGCNLPEEKVTTIMKQITTLTNISSILIGSSYTSDCGILDNNPGIITATRAFYGMDNLTNISNFFKNNPNLNNVDYCFYECVNLTGETPTNSEGKKLWERSGISGHHCFFRCNKLSDYADIPDSWKL